MSNILSSNHGVDSKSRGQASIPVHSSFFLVLPFSNYFLSFSHLFLQCVASPLCKLIFFCFARKADCRHSLLEKKSCIKMSEVFIFLFFSCFLNLTVFFQVLD